LPSHEGVASQLLVLLRCFTDIRPHWLYASQGWCAIRCDWTSVACQGPLSIGGIVAVRGWPYHESGRLVDWIGVRCMIRATPEDFVRPAADALAQIMLQCASDDPSLVRRSRGHGKSAQIQAKLLPAVQRETGSPFTLLSNSDRATRQYLEDLASIAGASAERADDVLLQARRRANRAVWAFASVAAVRVVVGAAGVVSSRSGNETGGRIPEIAGEVRSLGAQQQLTNHQLADMRSDVTGEHEAVAAVQQTVTPARPDSESASRDGAAGGRSSATSAHRYGSGQSCTASQLFVFCLAATDAARAANNLFVALAATHTASGVRSASTARDNTSILMLIENLAS